MSCERLRAILPQFDGRREDMASVLEMTVCFLQLAHSVDSGWDHLAVSRKQVGLVRPLQCISCVVPLYRVSMSLISLGPDLHPKVATCSAPSRYSQTLSVGILLRGTSVHCLLVG